MLKSIRYRLLIIFILLAVVPLLAIGAFFGQRLFDVLDEDALDRRRSSANVVLLEVDHFFESRVDELEALIVVQSLFQLDPQQQEIGLNRLVALDQVYQQLTLVDLDGQEQVRVVRGQLISQDALVDRSDSDAFRSTVADASTYFGPVEFDDELREPIVTIAIPILDLRHSEIEAVLIADVRFKPVWDLLASLPIDEDEDIFITDGFGQVVAHPNPSVVLRDTFVELPAPEGERTGLSNEAVLYASEIIMLGEQNLVIVSEQSAASARELAVNSLAITALAVVVVLAIAIVLVVVVVNWVARPVEGLSQVSQKLAAGDYRVRATINRQDEFGALAHSFNEMASAIEQRDAEISSQVEKLQVAIAQAEESSRLKTEFLSTMSHELRTPLNSIIGFTGMLLMGIRGEIDDKAQETLKRVQNSSEHLLSLINDVLDIAKIEAGRLELVPAPARLSNLVKSWQQNIEVLAQEKGLALHTSVDADLPDTIITDAERLTQIVLNLLSNAVKFTEAGNVTLKVQKVSREHWQISVCDTGIGIARDAQEYIFDEFRQVDGSYTRVHGGTGLGLPIAKQLTEAMGGNVRVESKLGEGSTFTVTLPLAAAPTTVAIGD